MAASVRAFSSGRAGLPSGFGTWQVSALQRSAGNQAVARLVAPPMFIARMPPPAPAPTASPSPGPRRPARPRPGRPVGTRRRPPSQTPNPPDAANPSSGINWDSFWSGRRAERHPHASSRSRGCTRAGDCWPAAPPT